MSIHLFQNAIEFNAKYPLCCIPQIIDLLPRIAMLNANKTHPRSFDTIAPFILFMWHFGRIPDFVVTDDKNLVLKLFYLTFVSRYKKYVR